MANIITYNLVWEDWVTIIPWDKWKLYCWLKGVDVIVPQISLMQLDNLMTFKYIDTGNTITMWLWEKRYKSNKHWRCKFIPVK